MNDTLGNNTHNSSIPVISPDDHGFLALRTAINSLCLILGLPINSYVVWLILSGAGGTIASEFFYLNLIASVIIFSLTAVFYFAWHFTNIVIFSTFCNISFFMFFFSVPLFQCCVCVERYIAVIHPVVFLRYKALQYRVACCCVAWLIVFAFNSLYFLSTAILSHILLGFDIVCISVVSFCCFSVLRALKQPGPGEGQRDSGEGNNMKRRAFNIILISLVVMVLTTLSYIPYVLSGLLMMPLAKCFTYVIAMMPVLVHPMLYIYKVGKLPCFKGLKAG